MACDVSPVAMFFTSPLIWLWWSITLVVRKYLCDFDEIFLLWLWFSICVIAMKYLVMWHKFSLSMMKHLLVCDEIFVWLWWNICLAVMKYLFGCDEIFGLTPTFSCDCHRERGRTGERRKCETAAEKKEKEFHNLDDNAEDDYSDEDDDGGDYFN